MHVLVKANVDLVILIVQATVSLHNYLRLTESCHHIPAGFVDCEDNEDNIIPGEWRREVNDGNAGLRQLDRIARNRYTIKAEGSRDDFMACFNSPAREIPWKLQHVRNCQNHLKYLKCA